MGDERGAAKWQQRIHEAGLEPTECSYSSIITAAVRNRNQVAAVNALEEMLSKTLQPSLVCFNGVIHSCSKNEEAEKWLRKLRESNLQPDEVTFTSLIHSAKRSPKQAARWLRSMISEGLKPSVECYTAVIDSCAGRGDLSQAAEWLKEMLETKIRADAKAYNSVINAAAKASQARPKQKPWI